MDNLILRNLKKAGVTEKGGVLSYLGWTITPRPDGLFDASRKSETLGTPLNMTRVLDAIRCRTVVA